MDTSTFVVGTESGPSPFVVRSEEFSEREGEGTRLSVVVNVKCPTLKKSSPFLQHASSTILDFRSELMEPLTLAKLK